jgi:hypothetical protein
LKLNAAGGAACFRWWWAGNTKAKEVVMAVAAAIGILKEQAAKRPFLSVFFLSVARIAASAIGAERHLRLRFGFAHRGLLSYVTYGITQTRK